MMMMNDVGGYLVHMYYLDVYFVQCKYEKNR